MTKDEALKLALDALGTVRPWEVADYDPLENAITALRQALEQPEQASVPDGWKLVPIEPTDAMLSVPVNIDLRECVTPGGVTGLDAVGLFRAWEAMIEAAPQPWNTTDMAYRPNGLNMEQAPVTWRNAAIRLGEDLYSVGPNGYYNMTASQWLDWALSVVNTAPPKPAQDLIVGYADSHDIASDGHDFWVSRQPGKNTVPLYLYGHPPKIWQGLTDEDIAEGAKQSWVDKQAFESAVWWAESKLREKNGF